MKTITDRGAYGDCTYEEPCNPDAMLFSDKPRASVGMPVKISTCGSFAFYEGDYWLITDADLVEKTIDLNSVSPASRVRARKNLQEGKETVNFSLINRHHKGVYSS